MSVGHDDDVREIVRPTSLAGVEAGGCAAHQVAHARAGLVAPIGTEGDAGAHEIGHGFLHGKLDALALARAQPLDIGGQDGHAGLHARARVAGGGTGEQGAAAEFAGDRESARRRLGHHVIGFVARVGPCAAEALELDIDQPGVKGIEGFVLKTEALDDTRAIVFDEDVVVRQHAEQHVAPLGLAEIQGQAALVGVQDQEEQAVAVLVRHVPARHVAAPRFLQFDHVGAEKAQYLSAGRTRLIMRHVDDADAVKRLTHANFPPCDLKPRASLAPWCAPHYLKPTFYTAM